MEKEKKPRDLWCRIQNSCYSFHFIFKYLQLTVQEQSLSKKEKKKKITKAEAIKQMNVSK